MSIGRAVKEFRPGDLLGFSACSRLGLAINLGTWGIPFHSLSHVAIVAPHPEDGHLLVYESTSIYQAPCVIRRAKTDGVQAHEALTRVMLYPGKVWHYRLRQEVTQCHVEKLTDWCSKMLGRPYDYLGAFRARSLPLGWIQRAIFGKEDLVSLFCSEFVAGAYFAARCWHRNNASAWNPNSLARGLLRDGVLARPRRVK